MKGDQPFVLTGLTLVLATTLAGQTVQWAAKAPKLQALTLQAPGAGWSIEYPRRDWITAPGGGSTLVVFVQRNAEAVVVLERTRLNVDLGAGELTDFFLDAEVELIKQDQPGATSFDQKILAAGGRRLFAVQYDRPGLKGVERIRQYSVPVGHRLYRLQCAATSSGFAKYDPVFSHMAATLLLKEQE